MPATEITLRVRSEETLDIAPLWDSVITQNGDLEIDWALSDGSEPFNVGGLMAKKALPTAIIICVWTDKWSTANEIRGDQDRKGWWGDSVDTQGFPELGCELHSLFRGRINSETAMKAEAYVRAGLKTLLDQGAVARFDVVAEADVPNGVLIINIDAFSESGNKVYETRWKFAWDQLRI